jgi:tetratricopeptide (TPR) repeat protein
MKINLLVLLIVLSLLQSDLYPQTTQTPPPTSPKKIEEPSTSGHPVMRLYDVPTPPEVESRAPEEVEAYLKITQSKDAGERAQLIEDFLKKYPESKYAPALHQMATSLYQQLNNHKKMIEHGEKTLLSFPSNPVILSLLALAYTTGGEPDNAIDRASKAIAIIEKLTPPANSDVARWTNERNQYLAMNYASMGSSFVAKFELERKSQKGATSQDQSKASVEANPVSKGEPETPSKEQPTSAAQNLAATYLAKGQGYLVKAVELNPQYEYAQFQLGVTYAYQNQAAKAMEIFARTVVLGGTFKDMARQNLEAIYKFTHKNSLDGMDELIAKAKEDSTRKEDQTQKEDVTQKEEETPPQ